MRTIAVADAFLLEHYYRSCFDAFPDFRLDNVLFFGKPDRLEMRDIARKIEREGPDSVALPEGLEERVENAEVLMTHLCPINSRLMERARNLKIILSNRGGLENIDLEAASRRGIPVLHNPAHNANSVAELTIGLMIAEMRNIARTHSCLMGGVWRERFRNAHQVFEISGKTVGIVGFGNIGRRVARKLAVFDCTVLVCDPYLPEDDPEVALYGCAKTDLATLLSSSDVVTLHARSDDLILGRKEIGWMKRGAYFINTARPHLIDNDAMYESLREGRLMGAAFDVFLTEPIGAEEPYIRLDNVTLTNHRGGDTENCYSDSPAMLLREARNYFDGKAPKYFANKSSIRTC
jgi:D-3-phosphoglycerate dehydrogenase / 2-oxoglutarate reductase